MKDCEAMQEQLSALLDGELDEAETRQVRAHLARADFRRHCDSAWRRSWLRKVACPVARREEGRVPLEQGRGGHAV